MFLRPGVADLQLIGYYLGKVITGLGLMMTLPALLAAVRSEWNSLTALVAGASVCFLIGAITELRLSTRRPLSWSHGAVIVALAWLVGAVLVAMPLYLSGHVADPLDAIYEAMAGLTSTGSSVLQDLDHLSWSMHTYRGLMHFAGGLGIVIVVLSLLSAGGARIGTLYVSEARDERILPNFIRTARFIFLVAGTYLVLGTLAYTVSLITAGLAPVEALLHGVNLFFSAFATGGFTPTSQSIGYYHSPAVESVSVVLMLAGSLSFGLHYQLWRGQRRELLRNLETRTLAIVVGALGALTMFGLVRSGTYDDTIALVRKGFFTLVSAQSSTGFTTANGTEFVTDWGVLAPAAIVGAMALGGMASSTAGGIKAVRVGITFKGLIADIRRILLPESALVVSTYHSQRRRILRDDQVRAAITVLLLYIATYLAGAVVALFYDQWDVNEAIFESVSQAANGGLSVGIISPEMPKLLQAVYVVQMWLGRLEFVAAFALLGYLGSIVRGRS